MSERPWWFPTAVFVAPVGVVTLVAALVLDGEVTWWVLIPLAIAGVLGPLVDLGRRETRARKAGQLPRVRRAKRWPPMVWRWPVTNGVASVAFGIAFLALWPWRLLQGELHLVDLLLPVVALTWIWSGMSEIRNVHVAR